MKIYLCLSILLGQFLSAEFLIVKKVGSQWTVVDMNDPARNQAIADVIMHYQWPMVIDTQLTTVEQDELLSSDKPYAEERFIAKKLQKIDSFYDVVFIPMTLYELFAMSYVTYREKC